MSAIGLLFARAGASPVVYLPPGTEGQVTPPAIYAGQGPSAFSLLSGAAGLLLGLALLGLFATLVLGLVRHLSWEHARCPVLCFASSAALGLLKHLPLAF